MKKATIASLLILCGSTAALAQVTTQSVDPGLQNNVTANTTVDQPVAEPVPMPEPSEMNTTTPDPMISNTPTPK